MKKTCKFISLVFAIVLILSAVTVSAQASHLTGYPNVDKAVFLGIIDNSFDLYATATVSTVSDLFARAYGNPAANTSSFENADTPATLDFIKMAYEATTGKSFDAATFWRYMSTGDYIANIELVNLVMQSLDD